MAANCNSLGESLLLIDPNGFNIGLQSLSLSLSLSLFKKNIGLFPKIYHLNKGVVIPI